MKLSLFATCGAILVLGATTAFAATHHHGGGTAKGGVYAEPAQPIAYSKLDDYLKASPAARANGSWGLETATASATTATGANVSATAPAAATTPQSPSPDQSAPPAPGGGT